MKNQGENKNRNNTFYSHEFLHFIADLMGPLSIFTFYWATYIYIYIYIYIIIPFYIYIIYNIYIYIQIYILYLDE